MNPIIVHKNKVPYLIWPPVKAIMRDGGIVLNDGGNWEVDETIPEILHLIEAAAVTKCGECIYQSWCIKDAHDGDDGFCGEGQLKAEILIERMAGK